jgi:hypothetical protein
VKANSGHLARSEKTGQVLWVYDRLTLKIQQHSYYAHEPHEKLAGIHFSCFSEVAKHPTSGWRCVPCEPLYCVGYVSDSGRNCKMKPSMMSKTVFSGPISGVDSSTSQGVEVLGCTSRSVKGGGLLTLNSSAHCRQTVSCKGICGVLEVFFLNRNRYYWEKAAQWSACRLKLMPVLLPGTHDLSSVVSGDVTLLKADEFMKISSNPSKIHVGRR